MKYYVHTIQDSDGDYEVHNKDCSRLPLPENREYLGNFDNCKDAVKEAKSRGYTSANGCYHCSLPCHTG